jgi:isopenicillin N synthase-like dioxygenase
MSGRSEITRQAATLSGATTEAPQGNMTINSTAFASATATRRSRAVDDLPIIDVAPLVDDAPGVAHVAQQSAACRDTGFFYAVGHGVDRSLRRGLNRQQAACGSTSPRNRASDRSGGEHGAAIFRSRLTSGVRTTEGPYFGAELDERDPRVMAATPLHGRNCSRNARSARSVLAG